MITDVNTQLTMLIDNMNNAATIRSYEELVLTPSIGQIVVVKSGGLWYRAKVLDTYQPLEINEECALVFMVDFGVEDEVPFSHVRNIPRVFLEFPFQVSSKYSWCSPVTVLHVRI